MKTNPLKFNYLKFDIIDIIAMIDYCPAAIDFVFTATSVNGDSYLQLVAHNREIVDKKIQYSDLTKVLQPYRNQAFEVAGPIVITNNCIAIAAMKQLIGYKDGQSNNANGFLLFTPDLNATNYVCYNVAAYTTINGVGTMVQDGSTIVTNPSPPATISL